MPICNSCQQNRVPSDFSDVQSSETDDSLRACKACLFIKSLARSEVAPVVNPNSTTSTTNTTSSTDNTTTTALSVDIPEQHDVALTIEGENANDSVEEAPLSLDDETSTATDDHQPSNTIDNSPYSFSVTKAMWQDVEQSSTRTLEDGSVEDINNDRNASENESDANGKELDSNFSATKAMWQTVEKTNKKAKDVPKEDTNVVHDTSENESVPNGKELDVQTVKKNNKTAKDESKEDFNAVHDTSENESVPNGIELHHDIIDELQQNLEPGSQHRNIDEPKEDTNVVHDTSENESLPNGKELDDDIIDELQQHFEPSYQPLNLLHQISGGTTLLHQTSEGTISSFLATEDVPSQHPYPLSVTTGGQAESNIDEGSEINKCATDNYDYDSELVSISPSTNESQPSSPPPGTETANKPTSPARKYTKHIAQDALTTVPSVRSDSSSIRSSPDDCLSGSLDYDDGSTSHLSSRIRLAICAMDKKARSKPMSEILDRLDDTLFQVTIFGDDRILNDDVEDWPICDALIAFYSDGYPLDKAEQYIELRKPFVLNDLKMQRVLKDRRLVYELLEKSGIDVPNHVFMSRDGYISDDGISLGCGTVEDDLVEHDDYIEINGKTINKPFLEKPVDADDHNIAIYYPTSAGGGCKKLFRKICDRSSEFYPDINEVRRDGSFIYEEFVETQGTDVKMYTVGPDYGHAEARKSPAVDGKVERAPDGKEVRFPVILTLREKEIARRIVLVFKQQVCGFDLLRVQEDDSLVSYVCDVNGWSFVKNSRKYYDDCAQILTEHMLAAVKPMALQGFSALDPLLKTIRDTDSETPKRKKYKKFNASSNRFNSELIAKVLSVDPYSKAQQRMVSGESSVPGSPVGSDISQSAATLEDGAVHVREIPDMLMNDPASRSANSSVIGDDEATEYRAPGTHQEELRCVLTVIRHGDRTPKQKLKVNISEPLILRYFNTHTKSSKKNLKVKAKKLMREFLETVKLAIAAKEDQLKVNDTKTDREMLSKLEHMRDVLERWKIGGLNRKLQLKPRKWNESVNEDGEKVTLCSELQLILKWGGNLTKLGETQSITLGKRLRHQMYPDAPGGGILRLHSTFRHDLKIKTSDEGRVMKTAAAFAKGLLELEGQIPPILVSLVHKEKDSLHMLDPSGNTEVKKELEVCKLKVNHDLQQSFDVEACDPEHVLNVVGSPMLTSVHKALKLVGNPRKTLFAIRETIGELLNQLDEMLSLNGLDENTNEGGEGLKSNGEEDEALCGIKLYKGETLLELTERWRLLHLKMYDEEKDLFDLSRVPDIHDNVRFDMLQNPHIGLTVTLGKLYTLAKNMADCVVPQEYGCTVEQKRSIGSKMCRALLEKIKYDLIIARTDDQVDMRYMINMDYSADLPINTMGRRIRTRLYFTSESHLHTLLNIMRFSPSSEKRLISDKGADLIGAAPELCYLTQIIIRLFENTEKDANDPKRFRIEILFSPGATATPSHMSELKRDLDSSRFDTEALQIISKDNLTCKEVEDYFNKSIEDGKTNDDDDIVPAVSTLNQRPSNKGKRDMDMKTLQLDAGKKLGAKNDCVNEKVTKEVEREIVEKPNVSDDGNTISKVDNRIQSNSQKVIVSAMIKKEPHKIPKTKAKCVSIAEEKNTEIGPEGRDESKHTKQLPSSETGGASDQDKAGTLESDQERIERMARVLARQYLWTSAAALSFVLGIGCLFLSREYQNGFSTRRWSRR